MNLRLFILLIIIEFIFITAGVIGLVFFIFFYFGSGDDSSSEAAMLAQNIWLAILTLIPLIFGVFNYRNSTEKEKAKSYLYSGLIVTIVSGIYFTMLI